MEIDLNNITFENDMCYINIEDNRVLVLNKVNENFTVENTEVPINRINIEVITYDEDEVTGHTPCTSIIGMLDENVYIKTDYTQFLGDVLTEENMYYCTIEV